MSGEGKRTDQGTQMCLPRVWSWGRKMAQRSASTCGPTLRGRAASAQRNLSFKFANVP